MFYQINQQPWVGSNQHLFGQQMNALANCATEAVWNCCHVFFNRESMRIPFSVKN